MNNSVVVRFTAVVLAVFGAACSNGQPYNGDGAGGHGGAAGKAGTGGASGHPGAGGSTGGHGGGGGTGTGGLGTGAGGAGAGGSATGGAGTGGSGAGGAGAGGSATGGAGTGGSGTGGMGTGGAGGGPLVCPATKHACAGGCVDNSAVANCGTRCDACTAPAGGTPTCDGTSCGFSCGGSLPKQCLSAGICVASSQCCSSSDCPTNAGGQTGSCDSATHTCNYSCTGSTKSCTTGGTTICIPTAGCCASSDCTTPCTTCDQSSHTCMAVKSATDPNGRCAGTCDASGACKSKQGQTCATTSGGCISGTSCVDGYCCNSACSGACTACDVAGHEGTCSPVPANTPPHGTRACLGTGTTCGGSCDGNGACSYPSGSCGGPSCSGTNYVATGTCQGGTCTAGATTVCHGPSNGSTGVPSCSTSTGCGISCNSGTPNNCGGACVNQQTDSKNCGGCGNKCAANHSCQSGSCTCQGFAFPAASCGGCASWNFESATAEGWGADMDPNFPVNSGSTNGFVNATASTTQVHDGTYALAVPILDDGVTTTIGSVAVPLCPNGAPVNLGGYTMSAWVMIKNGAGSSLGTLSALEFSAWSISGADNEPASFGTQTVDGWTHLSVTFSSAISADHIAIYVAPSPNQWSGTIYIDSVTLTPP